MKLLNVLFAALITFSVGAFNVKSVETKPMEIPGGNGIRGSEGLEKFRKNGLLKEKIFGRSDLTGGWPCDSGTQR